MRTPALGFAVALVLAAAGAAPTPGAGSAVPPYRLVYHALSGPTYQIFSVDTRTRRRAQLTFARAGASTPVPSPDGKRIAYVGNPLARPEAPAIRVMRPDGSDARRVADGYGICGWTADSRAILYWRAGEANLWISRLDGSAPREYDGQPGCPLFRRDGRASLRVLAPDGVLVLSAGGQQQTIAGNVYDAAWSPSGGHFAYRIPDGVAVARADGTSVRLVTGATAYAWSPEGRRLALVRGSGPAARLVVHTLADGSERSVPGGTGAVSVHWSPDGVLAFVSFGAETVQRVAPGGARRLVARPWLGALGWARDVRGARYRLPDPGVPHVRAGQIRALWWIAPLAAEGSRALLGAWDYAGSWVAGSPRIERTGGASACRAGRDSHVSGVAVTRQRRAWTRTWPGISGHVAIFAEQGGACVRVAGGRNNAGGVPEAGWLVGGGGSLVFGTTRSVPACGDRPCIPTGSSTIWRVATTGTTGSCPTGDDAPGPCEALATYVGQAQPMAVDGARAVVRAPDGRLEVLGLDGRLRYALAPSGDGAWDAALADGRLFVALRGRLQVFDAATGASIASASLPDVAPCSSADPTCPFPRLHLAGSTAGLVAYLAEGTLHLLRVRDGADRSLGAAVAAKLTDAGLFVSVEGPGRFHGRLRFTPLASLPLR